MSDENTNILSAVNGRSLATLVQLDEKTYIVDSVTGRAIAVIDGKIGGGVEVMTTAQRTAITPKDGQLIYDSQLETLFVGDGHTVGGVAVGSGGGGGGGTPILNCTISGNTANITLENGAGSVKLVGKNGTTLTPGPRGEVEIEADPIPTVLAMGEWTDEMEDVYDMGEWTQN